jgi:hypothetical protein
MKTLPKTPVVFRKWRDTGEVFAMFPELPSDDYGYFCESYHRDGRPGGADYFGLVRITKPASQREYRALKQELKRLGYKLRIIQRASRRMHENRHNEAKRLRTKKQSANTT